MRFTFKFVLSAISLQKRGITSSYSLRTSLPLVSSRTMATRVAVCQMQATSDIEENFRKVQDLVGQAKEQDAKMVFLPECCDFVGENRPQTLDLSESLRTGKLISRYRDLAKTHGMWLSLGGLHERISGTDKIHNCHVVINARGEISAEYRKLHMFDVDTTEFKFNESQVVTAGSRIIPPIDTPIGPLGLQICYDMRFAEPSVLLRKSRAKILTYPSAFAYTTGLAHWEVLLRSRAIENQCYVLAAAQTGWHNKKRRSYGHAMIIDPWGKILGETNPDTPQELIVADIDLTQVDKVRSSMPCFDHRRDDVYLLKDMKEVNSQDDAAVETYDFGGHVIQRDTVFMTSKHSIAFTNIRCVVPGHVLIASRRRAARLNDLSSDETVDFFQLVIRVQRLLAGLHGATSVTVTVQDGEDAGQTVKHVHCHVMPRHKGDFEENDMIYTELNKHDHDESKQRRDLKEMAEEAERYRQAVKGDD